MTAEVEYEHVSAGQLAMNTIYNRVCATDLQFSVALPQRSSLHCSSKTDKHEGNRHNRDGTAYTHELAGTVGKSARKWLTIP